MPGAEGLLEAQQSAALQIPYKNIAANLEGVQLFANAARSAADINLKKGQLQRQLEAMALKSQHDDAMMALREQQFGLAQQKVEWERDKALQSLQFAGAREDIAYKTLGLRQSIFDAKQAADTRGIEGTQKAFDAMSSLSERGITPGSKDFETELFHSLPSDAPRSVINAILRQQLNNHAYATKNKERDLKAANDSFAERFGRDVYGNRQIQDTNILENPESLPNAWTSPSTWFGETKIDPNMKRINTYDAGGVKTTKDVPLSTLKRYQKEWKDLQNRRDDMPTLHDHPDLGVTIPGKVLDMDTARKIKIEAGGDLNKARQIAIDRGYTIPN